MVVQAYNRQNDRILSSSLSSIPQEFIYVTRVQKTRSVIVWGGIRKRPDTIGIHPSRRKDQRY